MWLAHTFLIYVAHPRFWIYVAPTRFLIYVAHPHLIYVVTHTIPDLCAVTNTILIYVLNPHDSWIHVVSHTIL
jgi:hypothetical protein